MPITPAPASYDVDHLVGLIAGDGHLRECGHFLEVPEPRFDTELYVGACLFVGLGDVERPDQRPVLAVDSCAERGRTLLDDAPVVRKRVEAFVNECRPDGQKTDAVLSGQPRTRRRGDPGHGERDPAVGIRRELQLCIEQLMSRGLRRDGFAGKQAHDDVEICFEKLAGVGWGETDHRGVGGQRTGSHSSDDAAMGEVIEQHQAVGDPERVVIRE